MRPIDYLFLAVLLAATATILAFWRPGGDQPREERPRT
jgi:hypothetical protein